MGSMETKHTPVQNIQFFFACLFIASLNFEVFSPFVENFSVAKMAALLYLAFSLLTPHGLLISKNIKYPLLSVWSMFFLMVLSSIIYMQRNTTIFDTTLFLNIVMFWLLLNHQRRDERVFHEGLLWFSVSSFFVGLCYYSGIGITIADDMRVVVFGENANNLGIKMAVGALFLLNYCLNHSKERAIYKPWLLLMAIPMVALLLATASRVSVLILGSGVVLFILFRQFRRKGQKILWLLLGVVAFYYGFQIVLNQDVLMARMERAIDERSISGRDYLWEKYIDIAKEHPVLGVGFHGADQYAIEVFDEVRSPHNVLIEVAVYSGVLGLMCFLLFLFYVFYDVWRYRKNEHNLGPLITSMAIVGMVLSGQALGVKLFWTIAAYAISYRVISISDHSI